MHVIVTIFVIGLLFFQLGCFKSKSDSKNNKDTTDEINMKLQKVENEFMLNKLSPEEERNGWKLLFDGKTLKRFHSYNNKTDLSAWKTKHGLLYLDNTSKEDWQIRGGGDLVTDEEFDNFHLKLDWKISSGGNSGIMFRVQESPEYDFPWRTGLEMQILDNTKHPDSKIITHRAGDLYDLISAHPESAVKPVGQWNTVEIIAKDDILEFILNEEKVVSTILWNKNWTKLIENSKFKDWAGFGTFKKGKIALQDHGDIVWYRNIKIKPL